MRIIGVGCGNTCRVPFAPASVQRREVRVAVVEAAPHAHFEAVALVADEVDRHADRKIAAHRRIERHQHALRGVRELGRARDHAVDDRLAVLGLAGLEIRRVDAGLDEIAFGIDAEQAHRLAADLAADDERGVEADLAGPRGTRRRAARCRASRRRPAWRRRTSSARSRGLAIVASPARSAGSARRSRLRAGEVAGAQQDDARGRRDARTPSSCRTWRCCPCRRWCGSPRRRSCPRRALRLYSTSPAPAPRCRVASEAAAKFDIVHDRGFWGSPATGTVRCAGKTARGVVPAITGPGWHSRDVDHNRPRGGVTDIVRYDRRFIANGRFRVFGRYPEPGDLRFELAAAPCASAGSRG
jgi:hypothetical protein